MLYLPNDARITFSYTTHDRDTIFYGGDGRFKFPFQNTGAQPLVISMVKSSCGCLVGYGPREPVLAGEWDTIYGKYDTHRIGPISKSLTVISNDSINPTVILKIKGHVIGKPANIKLFNTHDSTEIKISVYNATEIELEKGEVVSIEIKNELGYDREISWVVSEYLKIETNQNITNEDRSGTMYANSILRGNDSINIKIAVLKTDEYYQNNLTLYINDTPVNIWLRKKSE